MRFSLLLLCVLSLSGSSIYAQGIRLVDAYPQKARYAPSEPVNLVVELDGKAEGTEQISATVLRLNQTAGQCEAIHLGPGAQSELLLHCIPPHDDYQGYLVNVRLSGAGGQALG